MTADELPGQRHQGLCIRPLFECFSSSEKTTGDGVEQTRCSIRRSLQVHDVAPQVEGHASGCNLAVENRHVKRRGLARCRNIDGHDTEGHDSIEKVRGGPLPRRRDQCSAQYPSLDPLDTHFEAHPMLQLLGNLPGIEGSRRQSFRR